MTEIRAIAIDPGRELGLAWTNEAGEADPRLVTCRKLGGYLEPGERYLALWETLKAGCPWRPTHVVFEVTGPNPRSGEAARRWQHGYLAHVQAWAAVHGAAFLEARPSQVRLWATGSGQASKKARAANRNAEKDRMRVAAAQRWPDAAEAIAAADHNAIDALWLLAWGVADVRGETR